MTKQQCVQCSKTFQITASDAAFYARLNVPAPTHCPDCRQQRRLAWRNEHTLYNRACDYCKKPIISIYPADSQFAVYCHECWWSDKWTAQSFGQDIDWQRPWFEQWQELQLKVPKIALYAANNEQSDYVNMTGYSKGCYMVFAGDYDEDCLYGTQVIKSVSCVDVLNCIESEDCYESVDIEKCYRVWWSQNCKNCTDSLWLFDCRGCTDCLFSTNLRNKRYYIFNKPYSAEAYAAKKAEILAKVQAGQLNELLQQFADLRVQVIHRPLEQANSETVTGDYIFNSHNVQQGYDVTAADQCSYVYTAFNVKDLLDVCHTTDNELSYEGTSLGYKTYNCHFSICVWTSHNCSYCLQVKDSHDVFGCIGLTKASYCILNKQYSPEDYKAIVKKLQQHMQQTGEHGQFFPMQLSPFAYNASMAQAWYPLTREQVTQLGLVWQEPVAQTAVGASDTLVCQATGKPYRIVQQERDWYTRQGLPLPTLCPDERRRRRFAARNPRQLWQRQCMCTQVDHGHAGRCATEFETSYSPERKELIYCNPCYTKEVI